MDTAQRPTDIMAERKRRADEERIAAIIARATEELRRRWDGAR